MFEALFQLLAERSEMAPLVLDAVATDIFALEGRLEVQKPGFPPLAE